MKPKGGGSAQWRLFYAMLGYGGSASLMLIYICSRIPSGPIRTGAEFLLGVFFIGFVCYVVLKYTLRYTLNSFLAKFNPLIEQPLPKPGNPLQSTELDNMDAFFGSLSEQLGDYITTSANRLSAQEQRLNRLYETMACGVIVWDAQGQVTHLNRGAQQILRAQPDQPFWDGFSHAPWNVLGDDGRALREDQLPAIVSLRSGQPELGLTIGLARPDLETTWIQGDAVPQTAPDGSVEQVVFSFVDITGRRKAEEHLTYQAMHDALTGLPNRALLADRIDNAIRTAKRDGKSLALMTMDLDRFKDVNDAFGHAYGDMLLKELGQRLTRRLRESDTIARLGGDDFAVLLPGLGSPEAAGLAGQKLLETFDRPFILEGQPVEVGASIGIALYPDHGEDVQTLMRRADVAMYTAKREHSGAVIYGDEQDPHSASRLTLRGELRRAIDGDELELFYQPKVNFGVRDNVHVEALVRWRHPYRGLVGPDDFIPLSEQSGLIKPLSQWVLNAALQQCQTWRQGGLEVVVSINLSMRNLQDPDLPAMLEQALARWQADPSWLNVEITESVLMANPTRAMEVLTRLNDVGIELSIDDFGTGYSSLSYLKRLPVAELKIDKSFVLDMGHDENDMVIVRSTIDLGHNLGLRVVAEGVEDGQAWDHLASLGCDAAQGFHMGRPMAAADFERWLRESPWSAHAAPTANCP